MAQPRISQLRTWDRHVDLVLLVLHFALLLLRAKRLSLRNEIDLNRELYFCLLEANRKVRDLTGDGFDHAPVPEGNNPPDPDDEVRTVRENKIPDFYWNFIDHTAEARNSSRNFFIECKRLGRAVRADRIFNQNYINQGAQRFVEINHGYAKGEKSAAMVGYIQDMDFQEILDEVNATARSVSMPILDGPYAAWNKDGVSLLFHRLPRSFRISPLLLLHFWIDLR
jgi:hypothetical protein